MTPFRKQMMLGISLAFAVSVFGCAQSEARPYRHSQHGAHRFVPRHHHAHRHHGRRHYAHRNHRRFHFDANGNRARLVTVQTAAGITVTVAADFAEPIKRFIADLVARGIKPTRIHCYSWAKSHRPNSLHHSGRACDFDGSANRFVAMNRHRVSDLAHRHGLRDGCDFNDCGHIDAGMAFVSYRRVRLAKR